MTTATTAASTACARQILTMLPSLRQWVAARVQQAGADLGLSLRQYAALHGIREGACSPGELARLWHVTPAVLTGIIDRLERRDLVRREADPSDRRRLRLDLTDDGLAASLDVERALMDDLAAQLATATPRQLAELSRSLELLQRTLAALDARPLQAAWRATPIDCQPDDLSDERPVPDARARPATCVVATATSLIAT